MVKPVSFKDKKEKDILNFLVKNGYDNNFSYYIKELIKKDMNGKENLNEVEQKSNVRNKRNTNFKI